MIVSVKTTGGIANIPRTRTVDSSTLQADEAAQLEARVAAADLEHMPSVLKGAGRGADRLHYEITVEAGGRHWVVCADEEAAPSALRRCIDHVHKLAREQRSRGHR
jgi:hypothetical protein